jgi:RHS repeat-associated protein
MKRPSRLVAFAALLFIACHGDGPAGSPGEGEATSTATSAVLKPPLTVPSNTIVADTAGVLAPTGDGAVSVDDRGQAHQHIPIWVPPGRAGMQPQLSLDYTSGGGGSVVGEGWEISGLSRITRCPGLRRYGNIAPPIQWNDADTLCLDGDPLSGTDGIFYWKFHLDGSRILKVTGSGSTAYYFKQYLKDGRIVTYGGTPDSQLIVSRFLPAPQIMTWAVSRIEDRAGNFMTFTYERSSGGDLRPKRIDYTGSAADLTTHRSVTFTYEPSPRPDIEQRVFGQQIFTYPDRLASIEMHAPNSANMDPLRSISFHYKTSEVTGNSLLARLAECDGAPPATLPVTGSVPLCRQQTFSYAPGVAPGAYGAFEVNNVDVDNARINDVSKVSVENVPPTLRLLDVDGDGRDDLLYLSDDPSETYHLRLWKGTAFGRVIQTGIAAAIPTHLSDTSGISAPIVLDFNMDGHADIIVNQGPVAHLYLANNATGGWTLGGPGYEAQLPAGYKNYQAADLDGNRIPDLVMLADGYAEYAINTDGTVTGLTAPLALPRDNPDYIDASNNYFLDFNNDGVTDVMTRRWYNGACVGNRVDDQHCKCDQIGYGVLDITEWLYPSYANPTPTKSTTVNGISYCQNAADGISHYEHVFGDFNGDGIVDTIQTLAPFDTTNPDQPMQAQLMLGGGTQSFNTQTSGGAFTLASPAVGFETLDVDGDGATDLLVRSGGATPFQVYSWKNQNWHVTPLVLGEPHPDDLEAFVPGDVNGDGKADFVALDGDGNIDLYTRDPGHPPADVLTGTDGDFTPTTTVAYQPYRIPDSEDRSKCVLPVTCVTRAGYLVSEVDVDNGVNGWNTQLHSYAGGRADLLGWGFLGFEMHRITDLATGAITTRTFDFTRNDSGPTAFYPFVGAPTEIDTTVHYQSGADTVTRTTTVTNQYEVQGSGPFMVNAVGTHLEIGDSNTSEPIDSRQTSRVFDGYGNETSERVQYFASAEELDTSTTYLNDAGDAYIIGRPTYVSTTSKTNITFTGFTSQTHETAYTYDALGQLAVQIDNPGAADGSSYDPLPTQDDGVQTLYTRYTRNGDGLPHIVEQLDNLIAPTKRRATQYDYDTTERMFVVQTTDPANLVTQAAYDPGLGVVAAQTDAAGVLTTLQYDTFGRIRADHPAAGGGRIVAYHAATAGNFGTVDDHRSGQYDTTTAIDSLGRTIQTITTGRADGKAVYVETTYDPLGRVHTVSRPHFAGVSAANTTTTYDTLGRVTSVQGADNSLVTTSYLGRSATTTNADHNMSVVRSDSFGRPLTSTQATTTGSGGLSGPVTTTNLRYGPFNTLATSTDTLGNVVDTSYDRMGRLRWKRDADRGTTARFYDVFGEVSDEIRGAAVIPVVFGGHVRFLISGGIDTQITYDGDGRVSTRTTPDITQTYVYDTVMPGKLSSESITGGPTISSTYDGFGRLKTKKWSGPRGAIGYAYTYDAYSRLKTMTYPALSNGGKSLVLRNTYSGGDIGGQLIKVDDVTTSTAVNDWQLVSTDASEAFPVVKLRNNVTTTIGEDPSHPGWLDTIVSKRGTATVQSLRYTREGGGRVQKREDLVKPTAPITETFGYDGLERLTSWSWTGTAGSRGATYVYDDIGNLQQRNVTAGPGASVTYTYTAPGFGPHQAVSDSNGNSFQYDDQGDQLVAPGRTFTWSSFARPATVTTPAGTYEFAYDAELARFSRTDPSNHTRYSYGGLFDELTDSTGTHDILTITANGKPVGEKEITNNAASSAPTNTLLTDALGSIDTIVTATNQQSIKYDPFGTRVTAADPTVRITTAPDDLRAGFTGHDHDDDVNLIDMVGRVYDPQQQRFLSTDPPAPDPIDGQAYNPYAYVRNNPLNATDPTGLYEVTLEGLSLGNDGQDTYTVWSSPTPIHVRQYWVNVYTGHFVIPYGSLPGEVQGAHGTEGPSAVDQVAINTPKDDNIDTTKGGDGGVCLCKNEQKPNVLKRVGAKVKEIYDGSEYGYATGFVTTPIGAFALQRARNGAFVLQVPLFNIMSKEGVGWLREAVEHGLNAKLVNMK